jgi:hypothetical protein
LSVFPFGDQVTREMTIADVEQLQFRQNTRSPNAIGHLSDAAQRIDDDLGADRIWNPVGASNFSHHLDDPSSPESLSCS